MTHSHIVQQSEGIDLIPETYNAYFWAAIESSTILLLFLIMEIITIKKVSLKNLETTKAISFLVSYTLFFSLKAIITVSQIIEGKYSFITWLRLSLYLVDAFAIFLVNKFVLDMEEVYIKLRS
jgi:hypothetical protein